MISLNSVRPFCWFHTYYLITTRFRINNAKISRVIILLSNRTLSALKCPVYKGFQKIFIIQTRFKKSYILVFHVFFLSFFNPNYVFLFILSFYLFFCTQNVLIYQSENTSNNSSKHILICGK